MTFKLITPPAALAVSLADAKLALRVDGNEQDALITAWTAGITEHAEHYTGRAFVNQTWRYTADSFPTAIKLQYAPVASVTSIKYLDVNGVLQTLNPADYFLDNSTEPGYIVPQVGKAWPATYGRINSVMVDYVAGYGPDDTTVPPSVKLFIQAKLVEQFDSAVRLEKDTVQASFIDRLLDRMKVYS